MLIFTPLPDLISFMHFPAAGINLCRVVHKFTLCQFILFSESADEVILVFSNHYVMQSSKMKLNHCFVCLFCFRLFCFVLFCFVFIFVFFVMFLPFSFRALIFGENPLLIVILVPKIWHFYPEYYRHSENKDF